MKRLEDESTHRYPIAKLAIGAALVVAAIQFALFISLTYSFSTVGERGQFGDMFGASTSFFSGLAFAGVLFTLYMQQKQITIQAQDGLEQRAASRQANNLNSLTLLLSHYTNRLDQLNTWERTGKGPANLVEQQVDLHTKINKIKLILESVYDDLVKEVKEDVR